MIFYKSNIYQIYKRDVIMCYFMPEGFVWRNFQINFIFVKSILLITEEIATTTVTSGKVFVTPAGTGMMWHRNPHFCPVLRDFVNQKVCWHSQPGKFKCIPPSNGPKVSAQHANLASTLNQWPWPIFHMLQWLVCLYLYVDPYALINYNA